MCYTFIHIIFLSVKLEWGPNTKVIGQKITTFIHSFNAQLFSKQFNQNIYDQLVMKT